LEGLEGAPEVCASPCSCALLDELLCSGESVLALGHTARKEGIIGCSEGEDVEVTLWGKVVEEEEAVVAQGRPPQK